MYSSPWQTEILPRRLGEAAEAVLGVELHLIKKNKYREGDPSTCGLGYVDISSVSYIGYPGTELMTTYPSPGADGSPCTVPYYHNRVRYP